MRGLAARAGHAGAPLSALRRILAVAGLILAGAVAPLGLLFTVMGAFFPGPEAHNDAFAIAFMFLFVCLGPLALGGAALWIGDRGLFLRVLRSPVTLARHMTEPAFWRGLVRSSLARALLCGLVVGLAFALGARKGTLMAVGLLVLTAFSIVDPIVVALRRGSWLRGIALSIVSWIALFLVGAATAEGMGPDGTVFLLPMMVYPGAVGVSGIVRLFAYLRARDAGPPVLPS